MGGLEGKAVEQEEVERRSSFSNGHLTPSNASSISLDRLSQKSAPLPSKLGTTSKVNIPDVSAPRAASSCASASAATLTNLAPEQPGDIELDVVSTRATAQAALAPEEGSPTSNETTEERLLPALAPMDGGVGAWSYLAGAFIIETVSWAFPTSYGLFLPAYMSSPALSNPTAQNLLPLIGTLGSGLMYCSGPVIYPLIARYPRSRRPCLWFGTGLCFVSLFASSYVETISALLALQGVLYGIGGAILYAPCMSYLPEWFHHRRGLANGVIFAGTAAGGVLLPLVLPYLIVPYGPARAVRYLSIAVLGSLLPALFLVRPRLRDPRAVRTAARGRGGWIRSRRLWILMAANTVQALAYFVPIIWIPTFAYALNLTEQEGSIALILINSVSVLSRVSLGFLADKVSPWALALTTLTAVSLFTFVVWGYFGTSLSTLYVYCVAYGIMAGGWTSLWTGFMKPITRDDPISSTTVFGFLLLSRGVGNVLSAPVSTALLHPQRGTGGRTGFEVGGTMFQSVIIYTGALFAGAAILVGAGWGLEWLLSERDEEDSRRR